MSVDSNGLGGGDARQMSRSFAGFHLNLSAKRLMQTSVDKLFEEGKIVGKAESADDSLKTPKKSHPSPSDSPLGSRTPPGSSSKGPQQSASKPQSTRNATGGSEKSSTAERDSDGSELYREYQKQRARVETELAERDRSRGELERQLTGGGVSDNRLVEDVLKEEGSHGDKSTGSSMRYDKGQ